VCETENIYIYISDLNARKKIHTEVTNTRPLPCFVGFAYGLAPVGPPVCRRARSAVSIVVVDPPPDTFGQTSTSSSTVAMVSGSSTPPPPADVAAACDTLTPSLPVGGAAVDACAVAVLSSFVVAIPSDSRV
jgi:hypothetical protein